MKISPVSFSGIIGATKTERGSNEYVDYTYTELNYYPYKDETKEQTDKFVKDYSFSNHSGADSYRDDCGMQFEVGCGYSDTREVKVCERLPFTERDHKLYESTPEKLSMRVRLLIKSVLEEIQRERKLNK